MAVITSPTDPTTVAIFARAPAAGRVKTRLAGAVGDDGAARLARAFLRDTWDAITALPWARPAVATTGDLGPRFGDVRAWHQGGGDLGARIERMLRRGLAETATAISMGADTPGIPRRLLDSARRALDEADVVLGPCDDGGFYLIGVRRCPPGLLADLPWSQPDTLARTEARLAARGLSVTRLSPWFDVDRPADLERLEGLIAAGEISAPTTERALHALRRAPEPGPSGPRRRKHTALAGASTPISTPTRPGNGTGPSCGLAEPTSAHSPAGDSRAFSPPHTTGVSVVIPTLDEEPRIGARLAELAATPGIGEVIVVDGGSSDGTAATARAFSGVRVLSAPRGRARQLNAGARAATGEVLLFLHADVALPADAARHVREALARPEVVAGAFRTWTVDDAGRGGWAAPLLHLADLRSRYAPLPYGDQAIFVRAEAFWAVGGFPDLPLMEDLALSRALRRRGRIRVVPASVRVSGRRFLPRPIYYTALVNTFPLLYYLGVPPRVLAALYGSPR